MKRSIQYLNAYTRILSPRAFRLRVRPLPTPLGRFRAWCNGARASCTKQALAEFDSLERPFDGRKKMQQFDKSYVFSIPTCDSHSLLF